MNVGRPLPGGTHGDDNPARWFYSGFDAFLANGVGAFIGVVALETDAK